MAETKSIKVTAKVYNLIKEISKQENVTMQNFIEKIIEEYNTKRFFEKANEAYLKMTPEDWKEEAEERKLLENTLSDGLEEENNEAW